MILIRFVIVILVVFIILLFSRFGFFFWKKKEEPQAGTEPTTPPAAPPKGRNWQNWKRVYQISGAILSVLIICIFLKWFYPTEFAVVLKSNSFWLLIVFLVLNIVLLGKTTGFVVLVRTAVLAATIAMILVVGANFVKGGPQVLANVRDFFVEPQHQKEIEKVRMSHKDILTAGIDKEIKQFQEIAKTRPLTEKELKKVDELEANLARIYSKPEGKKGEKRVLSGVFEVPAKSEIVSTGLIYRKGDYIRYEQLQPETGSFWICGEQKNLRVTERTTTKVGLSGGEVQLKGGPKPVKVSVRIIPD